MDKTGVSYLMYHELELPDHATVSEDRGYLHYVVRASDFEAQISWLKRNNFRGMNVSQALQSYDEGVPGVVITFDDGCETDFIAAAPILTKAGFQAAFYVVVGRIGEKGFLSIPQIRELQTLGFEIGCHSMTHPFLTDVDEKQLHVEIAEAKDRLEQILGRCVDHFSCPGGRWDTRVLRIARDSGYHSIATSRCEINTRDTNPYRLGRLAVLRETSLLEYTKLCCGQEIFRLRARQSILAATKGILGSKNYEKIRSMLMK